MRLHTCGCLALLSARPYPRSMNAQERIKWAQEYLQCDPNTGEPGYQELIVLDDLIAAMKAEAGEVPTEIVLPAEK